MIISSQGSREAEHCSVNRPSQSLIGPERNGSNLRMCGQILKWSVDSGQWIVDTNDLSHWHHGTLKFNKSARYWEMITFVSECVQSTMGRPSNGEKPCLHDNQNQCSRGCSTNRIVIHWSQSVSQSSIQIRFTAFGKEFRHFRKLVLSLPEIWKINLDLIIWMIHLSSI